MSKNEITGDELKTKAPTEAYRANYDAIFRSMPKPAGFPKKAESDWIEFSEFTDKVSGDTLQNWQVKAFDELSEP
jgi:hypothetical protein